MTPRSSTAFALLGAALIAMSFGLARFAFGLFVPPIRADLDLSPDVIGMIGSVPLISFLMASMVAPYAADYLGARNTAVLSAVSGAIGLAAISQAPGPVWLALGVFACGVCTGLMMPALTAAMQALVKRSLHGRVSSVMNAGTSIGIALAAPALLLLNDAWRFAYLSFALLAAVGALAAWILIPSVSRVMPGNAAPPPKIRARQWSRLFRLSLFAFAMGFISSAYWVFAPDLAVSLGGLASSNTGWLWLAVGIAGLGGATVADLADRNNPPITHALMLTMLAASLALLAASPDQLALAGFSALIFGLAYMSLTGLYLMTGVRLLPGHLSMGPVLPFMAVSLGQAAGSPLLGLLAKDFGYANAFALFCAIGISVSLLSPFYPRYLEATQDEETSDEETGLQAAYDYQLQNETGEPLRPAKQATQSDGDS